MNKDKLKNMKSSEQLFKLWKSYQITSPYSINITFASLFDSLEYITKILSEEEQKSNFMM